MRNPLSFLADLALGRPLQAQLIAVNAGGEQVIPVHARAPGVVAAHPHVEAVQMQPGACFRLQQMLVAAGHQLL